MSRDHKELSKEHRDLSDKSGEIKLLISEKSSEIKTSVSEKSCEIKENISNLIKDSTDIKQAVSYIKDEQLKQSSNTKALSQKELDINKTFENITEHIKAYNLNMIERVNEIKELKIEIKELKAENKKIIEDNKKLKAEIKELVQQQKEKQVNKLSKDDKTLEENIPTLENSKDEEQEDELEL